MFAGEEKNCNILFVSLSGFCLSTAVQTLTADVRSRGRAFSQTNNMLVLTQTRDWSDIEASGGPASTTRRKLTTSSQQSDTDVV